MSLGIVFKRPEGIVLAADSWVTLNAEMRRGDQVTLLPRRHLQLRRLPHASLCPNLL